ncbi:uncharacterized protein LACBIDRAFT_325432 [Laccaria bicolor S238N-H82]|uniref:Predicted protein n=1 Tax=Laccaria bicolor (strain S238N-H82 / ATCC MYA-4686) TaxID=486041 RepID=B0D4W6_LACBS|nr:uncharacterized protein LACBIDRAFT_325432 [Laccaria bicolor S238N-H82]EDR10415.1 predicted protein [Laccaria bicolor S238N-H82]|eukprot:XP_001878865.1 predicted protein [Laccaria bicolor S238N-H82]
MAPVKRQAPHRDKSPAVAQWIPKPFNLLEGNPFEYSQHDISSVSGTEAFETSIQTRDGGRCVVCGCSERRALDYCHIVPTSETDTWDEMRDTGFVPRTAKSVEHEPRNGIQLLSSHTPESDPIVAKTIYFYQPLPIRE